MKCTCFEEEKVYMVQIVMQDEEKVAKVVSVCGIPDHWEPGLFFAKIGPGRCSLSMEQAAAVAEKINAGAKFVLV